jgi:hypothetical protein
MIDSVGGMWVGSLDEMSDEIKTGNRFKKQKYKSFLPATSVVMVTRRQLLNLFCC